MRFLDAIKRALTLRMKRSEHDELLEERRFIQENIEFGQFRRRKLDSEILRVEAEIMSLESPDDIVRRAAQA